MFWWFCKGITNIAWETDNPLRQSCVKWLSHSSKISYSLCFFPRFQWNCIVSYRFPLPLFNVECVRLSDRFCGHNNIEMGRRTKMYETEKSSLISTVSQLFLHGIVEGDTRDITQLQPSFGNQLFVHLYKVVNTWSSDVRYLLFADQFHRLRAQSFDQWSEDSSGYSGRTSKWHHLLSSGQK